MFLCVTVQRKISMTILSQEFENERILLLREKKNYQKEGRNEVYVLQFLSIHLNALDIL